MIVRSQLSEIGNTQNPFETVRPQRGRQVQPQIAVQLQAFLAAQAQPVVVDPIDLADANQAGMVGRGQLAAHAGVNFGPVLQAPVGAPRGQASWIIAHS